MGNFTKKSRQDRHDFVFSGVTIRDGAYIYADNNGILVADCP
nr:hypothetical protein [Moraxella nasovis]